MISVVYLVIYRPVGSIWTVRTWIGQWVGLLGGWCLDAHAACHVLRCSTGTNPVLFRPRAIVERRSIEHRRLWKIDLSHLSPMLFHHKVSHRVHHLMMVVRRGPFSDEVRGHSLHPCLLATDWGEGIGAAGKVGRVFSGFLQVLAAQTSTYIIGKYLFKEVLSWTWVDVDSVFGAPVLDQECHRYLPRVGLNGARPRWSDRLSFWSTN